MKLDHVPGPVLERILDVVPGPSWCPLQLDPSVRQRLRQRVSEPPSFLFDVEIGEIVGTGDDPEDPQRSGNTQRIDRRRNREMADERLSRQTDSCRSASNIVSQGSAANSGALRINTIRSASPLECAVARLAW